MRIIFTIIALACLIGLSACDSKVDVFTAWVEEAGIDLTNFKVVDFSDTGRGIMAGKAFKEGEVLLSIPSDFMITMAIVDEDEKFSTFFEAHPEIHPTYKMAMYVMYQKSLKEDSKYAPYLDLMPEIVPSTLTWTPEELAELQGSSLRNNTLSTQVNMEDDFNAILGLCEDDEECDKSLFADRETWNFENFRYGVTIVTSRSFVGQYKDTEAGYLVPIADMFNHQSQNPPAGFEFDVESQTLNLHALSDIAKGQQIFVSLGDLSNSLLMLRYGFVEAVNDNDGYVMTLVLSGDDPLFAIRKSLLESHGIEGNQTSFILRKDRFPSALVAALRLNLAKISELERHEYAFADMPLSLLNELDTCRTLLASIEQLLQKYETNIEDDEILLKTKLDDKLRMAVTLRHSEKSILLSVSEQIQRYWLRFLIDGYNPDAPLPEVEEEAPVSEVEGNEFEVSEGEIDEVVMA